MTRPPRREHCNPNESECVRVRLPFSGVREIYVGSRIFVGPPVPAGQWRRTRPAYVRELNLEDNHVLVAYDDTWGSTVELQWIPPTHIAGKDGQ